MRKGKINKALSLLAATLLSTSAYAAEEAGTILPDWQIYGDGILFFHLSGTHSAPTCSIPERWAIDTQTPVGKAQYAAFLAAVTTGKTVNVTGTGGCAHGNTEVVFQFRVIG